jgi:4-amino-4-deoxy-L-arabinose transferase-like glycosyltransferase
MTSQPSGENTAMSAQRVGWAVLIIVTLYICYFSHLGVMGFVGPDEPRYAWIARDMAETGDWVTPRLYGRPWFEKPPLLYWGGALFFKLFGSSAPEAAARLPGAISALLATLALAWLAWRSYGEECARWLLLLLPTSVGMIGFSHAAATDMPFAGMLTIAMVCAAVALGLTLTESTPILPRTPWFALVLFGFFVGLAVLAKGPAAIILCGGAVLFWAIFTKRWRDALRLLHPAAIASFCLTSLPWYILCARRNPDFLRVFIIEHNFKRYLTPEFQHVQPFWFYLPIMCIALLPWVVGVLSAVDDLVSRLRSGSRERGFEFLALCWFLWPLLFFSVSKSKLPGYILPAVPPVMLLVVGIIFGNTDANRRRTSIAAQLIGATLLFAGIAFRTLDRKIPGGQEIGSASWHLRIFLSLLIGGLISTYLARKKHSNASLLCSTATMLFALLGAYDGLHWIDPLYSARNAATGIKTFDPNFDPAAAAAFQLPRGAQFGLNFYLRREIPHWSTTDSATIVFTTPEGQSRVENAGFQCRGYVVFPAVIPCRSSTLLDRLGSGRQPRQEE